MTDSSPTPITFSGFAPRPPTVDDRPIVSARATFAELAAEAAKTPKSRDSRRVAQVLAALDILDKNLEESIAKGEIRDAVSTRSVQGAFAEIRKALTS